MLQKRLINAVVFVVVFSASVWLARVTVSAATVCEADINTDGQVDTVDLSILTTDFLSADPANTRSDIDSDGLVDLRDYGVLSAYYLQSSDDCTSGELGPNLLQNGDFEKGSMPPWSGGGSVNTEVKHAGNYAGKFISEQYTRQGWISVTPGKPYIFSTWFRWEAMSGDGWGDSKIEIHNSDWTLIAQETGFHKKYSPGEWVKVAIAFTPTKNQVQVSIGVYGPRQNALVYFDDVALQEKIGNSPPELNPQADKVTGSVPFTVNFQANANDPDGAIDHLVWNFGDGTESRDFNPQHVYTSRGSFVVELTAHDNDGAKTTERLNIEVTDSVSPIVTITSPVSTETYETGASSMDLAGNAQGQSNITSVVWDNVSNGEAGIISITQTKSVNWSATVPLKPGNNHIVVTATDAQGNTGTDRIVVTRAVSAPRISEVHVNTAAPRVYDKYEVTFQLETVAAHPMFMYDPAPPPGTPIGTGVTAEAVITTPTGQVVRQPAFYNQDTQKVGSGNSAYYELLPTTNWKIRYSPQQEGIHQVNLFAQDASGTVNQVVGTFTASSPVRRGFVNVSTADARYFEYSNGDLHFPVGPTFIDTAQSGVMNNDRPWLGGRGAYTSRWARWWNSAEDWGNEGAETLVSYNEHFTGSELSYVLSAPDAFRYWLGWTDDAYRPRYKPSTTYQIKLRVKLDGVTGSQGSGLVIKTHGFWSSRDPVPSDVQAKSSWIPLLSGTKDWHTMVVRYTTPANLNPTMNDAYMSVFLQNVTAGSVFIDELSIRQVNANGTLGAEMIRNPKADHHTYVEQRPMGYTDAEVETNADKDIFARYVVHDKNDWVPNHLSTWGTFVQDGEGYYQPENTRSTWQLKQWWRYLVARYGYSVSVFSWELNNEGPPDDGTGVHARTTQIFARWVQELDAHPHMATTSFWGGWKPTFWGDEENFPNISYADIHRYGGPTDMVQWYLDDATVAFNDNVGKPVIRGETGIDGSLSDLLKKSNPGVWFHNLLWSQLHPSSMYDVGYWYDYHLKYIDAVGIARAFAKFVDTLEINKGGYADLAATNASSSLHVFGQKNLSAGKAYGWVHNKSYTWKNVMDGVNISPVTNSFQIKLSANTTYIIDWYDTSTGNVSRTENKTSGGDGNVTLTVTSLTADTAFKLRKQ